MMERNENISAPQHSGSFEDLEFLTGDPTRGSAFAAAFLVASLPLGAILWVYAITVLASGL